MICIALGWLLTISSACPLSPVVGLDGVAHDIRKHEDKKEDNVRIGNCRHCAMNCMTGERVGDMQLGGLSCHNWPLLDILDRKLLTIG